jgi:hypothetical protein
MWLFVLILTTFSASAEIFTLSTENNVTCVVTESDAKAAVYINPPIKSDYKAIVTARKSDSIRLYPSIKPDRSCKLINWKKDLVLGVDLSVYCSNETTLWVKFQLPLKTSESNYRIWYKQSDPDACPMRLETLSRCEFWNGFVCGRIDNLAQGIDYSLIVEQ